MRIKTGMACVMGVFVAVAACVGDEPAAEPTPDGGSTSGGPEGGGGSDAMAADSATADTGVDAADAAKPLAAIDRYSVTTAAWSGTFAECVNAIDTAAKGMGGSYVASGTSSTFSRYADRPGVIVTGTCVDVPSSIVTAAWGIEGAADVSNDEQRFKKLVATEVAPAVSPGKTGLPGIRGEKKIHSVTAIALSTCVNRAQTAITKLLAASPVQTGKWTSFTGTTVRAAGVSGTSASITCLGDTGSIVIDVFTIDPSITSTTPLVNSLVTEFTNAT